MDFESKVSSEDLYKINNSIYTKGYIDREHILQFLQSVPTTDGPHIVKEVKHWLTSLHNDPKYSMVSFPGDDINAVISDLDSYGHISSETVLKFKEEHGKSRPVT